MIRPHNPCESKIVLLAKPRGITSFSAISSVKSAFCAKAGHTGTLDSFADGLLVVLTGKLTRLAPFIEALPKEYRAEISFGVQTDTLDPTGTVVREKPLPTAGEVLAVLPSFTGKILQTPPEYSALKQGGKRLSDLARSGVQVSPQAREITVYQITPELLISQNDDAASPEDLPADSPVAKAVVRVRCSKGTYIRALARDIAEKAGSAAFLSLLRRLSVGSFLLENAAGFSALKAFPACCENAASGNTAAEKPLLPSFEEIRAKAMDFTPEIAETCGFNVLFLKESALDAFRSGKALSLQWFETPPQAPCGSRMAVFCRNLFAGVIHAESGELFYDFVF